MNSSISDKKKIKIIVLYNEVNSLPTSDTKAILAEAGAKDDAEIIRNALNKKGYKAEIFEVTENNFLEVTNISCNIFFNLCDGIGEKPHTESEIPKLLENNHKKFTGSNSKALLLTSNKIATKEVFLRNNIPTAKYVRYNSIPTDPLSEINFPVIVKPIAQDCSTGLSSSSVVYNDFELKNEVKRILQNYGDDVLVEEFKGGREFNVTMIGNGSDITVFPVSEIIYGKSYSNSNKPKIIDFDAKWIEDSVNYLETNGKCPADIDLELEEKIRKYSKQAFLATGVSDYARVDIRLGENNIPYFLEINANPDLYPGMGASKAALAKGLSYEDFIEQILLFALRKYS